MITDEFIEFRNAKKVNRNESLESSGFEFTMEEIRWRKNLPNCEFSTFFKDNLETWNVLLYSDNWEEVSRIIIKILNEVCVSLHEWNANPYRRKHACYVARLGIFFISNKKLRFYDISKIRKMIVSEFSFFRVSSDARQCFFTYKKKRVTVELDYWKTRIVVRNFGFPIDESPKIHPLSFIRTIKPKNKIVGEETKLYILRQGNALVQYFLIRNHRNPGTRIYSSLCINTFFSTFFFIDRID